MAEEEVGPGKVTRWSIGLIVAAVLALVVTGAVIWPGYDAAETPKQEISVWALQSSSGKRYARVNTELGELDTVRGVENAVRVVQSGSNTLLFTDGYSRFAKLDPGRPPELVGEVPEFFERTPADTSNVASNLNHAVFLTSEGVIFSAPLTDPTIQIPINPYRNEETEEGEEPPVFVADAIAISPNDEVAAYSIDEKRVVYADPVTGDVTDEEAWAPTDATGLQMAFAGESLVLFDPATGELWFAGDNSPVVTGAERGAQLQDSAGLDTVFISDSKGMIEVNEGTPSRVFELEGTAEAAQPLSFEGQVFGAWLGPTEGHLWSNNGDEAVLSYGNAETPETLNPRLVSNGSRMIVNDAASGWVWLAPSGELVQSSQQWDVDENVVEQVEDTVAEKIIEPKPPVAAPDSFGVRAGQEILLPVLLNDHDPNEDALSIAPGSIEGLPEEFGTLSIAADMQQIVVKVPENATGSATFAYKATDGTAADGLKSEAAAVTLTVVPEEESVAPAWCGVEECLAIWPTPSVEPGGAVTTNVLPGWVDPDGDAMFVQEVSAPEVGAAIAHPDGTVTYRHPDTNAKEPVTVPIEVTVADTTGQSAKKTLNIQVTPTPSLKLEPIVVAGVTGQPVSVELAKHISGTVGKPILKTAAPTQKDSADVKVSGSDLSFTLLASEPGSYPVQVTLEDDRGEPLLGLARVIVTKPEDAQVSTVPLTVFIRPNEDTTVDIMPTVTNPAGLVLMVNQLVVSRSDNGELLADVVGQRNLHASGRTVNGKPGTLGVGTFEVSDGSGNENGKATGQVTFIMLGEAGAAPPITVDDHVTVTVGAQIDIPVLDNDIAPAGSQLVLDPLSIVNEQQEGLAFASRRYLRYLAPTKQGEYSITYAASRLGSPDLTSTARVRITVKERDNEARPRPRTLTGRVLQGKSVRIAFDRFKADQNGAVVELSQVTKQPTHGTAAIAPEGDAIIYTAYPDKHGQDSFEYQVRDQSGKVGEGRVRLGILNAEADPRPITYSDYLQIEVGSDSEAVTYPVASDIDPAGGVLRIADVIPNAVEGTELFKSLHERLISVDPETGEVRIRAGDDPGTNSYVYTVMNELGDTAKGLIVVKTVRGKVPDTPVAEDTVLTAETLEGITAGIDVVTDKVTWNTGNVSELKLSLWDETGPYSAEGWKVLGKVPDKWTVIPFKLSGKNFAGDTISTYGFLRVPGPNDIHLSLRAAYQFQTVNEEESVRVNMSDAVAMPEGERLEIDGAQIHTSGVRSSATCSIVEGTTIEYVSGAGAPWHDSCTVPVKVSSQDLYTYLTMGIEVVPREPQPILRSASFEVSPGETKTYDVKQMVTWEGEPRWDGLKYSATGGGQYFDVALSADQLTVVGHDDARQGNSEQLTLSLPDYSDAGQGKLNLTVGPAPGQNPTGGTAVQACSASEGNSCTIQVIGTPGEDNSLSTPLELVSVENPLACPAVKFAKSGQAVVASWPENSPGSSDCTASFEVEDAQGRTGQGTVTLDLLGYPRPPSTIEWIGYSADSVTLRLVPDATPSSPAVTNYAVTGDGKTITCSPNQPCTVPGMTLGKKVSFQAVAENPVGKTTSEAQVLAWAYRPPNAPQATSEPSPNGNQGERALVTVTTDDTTGMVSIDGKIVEVIDSKATLIVDAPNNSEGKSIAVIPMSSLDLPKLSGGGSSGEGVGTNVFVHGIGAPTIDILATIDENTGEAVADVSLTNSNGMPGGVPTQLGIGIGDECTYGTTHISKTLKPEEVVKFTGCGKNFYNGKEFGATKIASQELAFDIKPPGNDGTYGFKRSDVYIDNETYTWGTFEYSEPSLPSTPGVQIKYASRADAGIGEMTSNLNDLFPSDTYEGLPDPPFAFACNNDSCSSGVAMNLREDALKAPRKVLFPQQSGGTCPNKFGLNQVGVSGTSRDQLFLSPGQPGGTTEVRFGWDNDQLSSPVWSCTVPEPPAPSPMPPPSTPSPPGGEDGGDQQSDGN